MPKLLGVVDTLESVDEKFRGQYEKDGEKFRLKEIEFEDTAEYKSKLAKKEQLLTDANKSLGRYSKLKDWEDDELERIEELREKLKSGKSTDAQDKIDKAEHDRLLKKLSDKAATDLAERDGKIATYEAQLKKYKLTDPLRTIALEAGIFPEDFDVAMLEIGGRFKLLEEEGKKAKIIVLDEDGDEADVTPTDFFNKLYFKQRPKFFKPRIGHGSGADNRQTAGDKSKAAELGKLSPMERMNASRQSG